MQPTTPVLRVYALRGGQRVSCTGDRVDRDATPTTLEHMRIEHRRSDILVSQEFLHNTDIGPLLQQVRGKAVPQGVATASICNPRLADRLAHGLL